MLLFLFKLQTLIDIQFPCLAGSIMEYLTFTIKTFPQRHESPLPSPFHWCLPFSVQLPSLLSQYVTVILPGLLTDLLSTLYPDLLSTIDLLILILPVCSIFSSDAALVLVDAQFSLDVILFLVDKWPIG